MLCEHGNVVATNVEVYEGVDVGQLVVGDVVVEQPVIPSVDSPWEAAMAKMDAFLVRLAIDRERFTPSVCMLDNRSGIFRLAWCEAFVLVEEEEVSPRTPISSHVGLSPLDITPIVWEYPSEGICMLNILGGVSTNFVAILALRSRPRQRG
ncbi:unnamed protein product [Sphagnum jensenii]|uniref:Uncharacterized protein n=1 Tax=Sphagnum jensenii TaxID=128206 RepID=A0ABP0W2F6_9BRYO